MNPFRANGSEFADSAFSNVVATFCRCLSISDCEQAIDKG